MPVTQQDDTVDIDFLQRGQSEDTVIGHEVLFFLVRFLDDGIAGVVVIGSNDTLEGQFKSGLRRIHYTLDLCFLLFAGNTEQVPVSHAGGIDRRPGHLCGCGWLYFDDRGRFLKGDTQHVHGVVRQYPAYAKHKRNIDDNRQGPEVQDPGQETRCKSIIKGLHVFCLY